MTWATRDRAEAAEAEIERLKTAIAAVLALPVHSISGYEWECDDCHEDEDDLTDYDRDGIPCDHGMLIDLYRVRALLATPRRSAR